MTLPNIIDTKSRLAELRATLIDLVEDIDAIALEMPYGMTLPPPEGVKVVSKPGRVQKPTAPVAPTVLPEMLAKVKAFLDDHPGDTYAAADVSNRLNLRPEVAAASCRVLVERGQAVKHGEKRWSRYGAVSAPKGE